MSKGGKVWLIVGGSLALFSVGAWFTGSLLGLTGVDLWRLRAGLWLLGALGAGAVLFLLRKPAPKPPAEGVEIDALIAAARAHLASARLARRAGLDSLPVVLLVGPSGSTKTTLVLQSGADAELLAGEGIRESSVTPTPA
ncbi:MAG TPA: hypothetical protein VIQ27_09715, partial [Gemmatimonadales bacterium]